MRTMILALLGVSLVSCNESRNRSIELANQGIQKFQNRLFDSAESDLQGAVQLDPSNTLAHYNLGKVYEELQKWDSAAEEFSKAADQDPGNANYHYDLGHAYQKANKLADAEKEYLAALKLNDKLYKAAYRLGTVYETLEKPKQADDAYRKAITTNPRFSHAFVSLGFLYLNNDYLKEAQQVFQNATTANEKDGESWYGLGLVRKELKDYDGAIDALKKAQANGAASPDLKYNLALAMHAKGDDAGAKTLLQQFVQSGGGKAGADLVKAASDLLYTLP